MAEIHYFPPAECRRFFPELRAVDQQRRRVIHWRDAAAADLARLGASAVALRQLDALAARVLEELQADDL